MWFEINMIYETYEVYGDNVVDYPHMFSRPGVYVGACV